MPFSYKDASVGAKHSKLKGLLNSTSIAGSDNPLVEVEYKARQSNIILTTIFALGIIGTGLLAVRVMAGASGYALSDALGWKEGLSASANDLYYWVAIRFTNFTNIHFR